MLEELIQLLCLTGLILFLLSYQQKRRKIITDTIQAEVVESKGTLENANETEKEYIEKRVRVAQQTRDAILSKDKAEIQLNAAEGTTPVPPGQKVTKKWTVLDLGLKPRFRLETEWTLKLHCTGKSLSLSFEDIKALGTKTFNRDFHCYTGWTMRDLTFTGVPFKSIIKALNPPDTWKFLYQVGADGYTCNAPRVDFERDDVFLAFELDGNPLPYEHGAIRLINSNLYGSKSAKYLLELHFLDQNIKGFWESRGVHERGNVWLEERFDRSYRTVFGIEEAKRIIGEMKRSSRELDLSGLKLEQLPEEINPILRRLTSINLSSNPLLTCPANFYSSMKNLTILSINANQLTTFPDIFSLVSLHELWICDNQLTSIPDRITELRELQCLGIDTNKITSLPTDLYLMEELFAIFGDGNQITHLPAEWATRPWRALMFSNNPTLQSVPTEWHQMTDIQFFGFYNCPAFPPEVLEEGTPGILAYLKQEHTKKISQ